MTAYSSGLALKEKGSGAEALPPKDDPLSRRRSLDRPLLPCSDHQGMFAFQLLLLAVLHLADLILTLKLYFHGPLGELNPIADLVLDRTGGLGLAIFKVLLICFVIVVMRIAYPKHKVFVRFYLRKFSAPCAHLVEFASTFG